MEYFYRLKAAKNWENLSSDKVEKEKERTKEGNNVGEAWRCIGSEINGTRT